MVRIVILGDVGADNLIKQTIGPCWQRGVSTLLVLFDPWYILNFKEMIEIQT